MKKKGNLKDSRSELYEEGIELLLEKWDDSRDIERDPIYKKLSTRRKEDLLSQIAFNTFVKSEYFFKQKTLEYPISNYIQNLPDVQTDSDALLISSRKVLRSVEAQHGLLVERARGIYSFSHLTFQEYFTARNIIASRPNLLGQSLQELVNHIITEKRWREVFLLTAEMLPEADYLLELMKAQVDSLLDGDEKMQKFLSWVNERSTSIEGTYKLVAIRALYLDLNLDRALDRALARARARARARALDLDLDLDFDFAINLDRDLDLDLDRDFALDFALDLALNLTLDFALDLDLDFALDLDRALDRARALDRDLNRALDYARNSDSKLEQALRNLKVQLPDREGDFEIYKQWWQTKGKAWSETLRAFMIEHRNIGHDWQFSDEQKKILNQYYDANKFLVDCLNSNCYVTRSTRDRIEDTLLLPIAEIERRKGQQL